MERHYLEFGSCLRDIGQVETAKDYLRSSEGTKDCVVTLSEKHPSLRDSDELVTVILISTNPKKSITPTMIDEYLRMLKGIEPTRMELPKKRNGTDEERSLERRKAERVRKLSESITYMEVEEVDSRDEASAFMRGDGVVMNGASKARVYVRMKCYCKTFFSYGGSCSCCLVCCSMMEFLPDGRTIFELESAHFAGQRRVGRRSSEQSECYRSYFKGGQGREARETEVSAFARFVQKAPPMRFFKWHAAFVRTCEDDKKRYELLVGIVQSVTYPKNPAATDEVEWRVKFDGESKEPDRLLNKKELIDALVLAKDIPQVATAKHYEDATTI